MNEKGSNFDMVFGFNRETDERSLKLFMQRIAGRDLLEELIPRLSSKEIDSVVALFTGLMKSHLSKKEYHRLYKIYHKSCKIMRLYFQILYTICFHLGISDTLV